MKFSKLYAIPIASFAILVVIFVAFPFEYAWFIILPFVGMIALLSNFLIPFFWMKRVPQAARDLVAFWQQHLVPALIAHDSGRCALVGIIELRGEGLVKTTHGNYRLLPRFVKVTEEAVKEKEEEKKGQRKKKPNNPGGGTPQMPKHSAMPGYILDYNTDWVNKRSILLGYGAPIYLGYSGKLCLLNPVCMAWYEAGELYVPTETTPPEGMKDTPMPLMLVNPLKMKEVISRRFDSSQIKALARYAEEVGHLGKGISQTMKIFLGLGVIALLAIVAMYVLPGMTGGA